MKTTLLFLLSTLLATASFAQTTLEILGRYEAQEYKDHLMGVERVLDHHALVASFLGLALVDLEVLPGGGTPAYVDRLEGIDVYTTVTRPDGVCYANLRLGGILVVRIDPSALTLTPGIVLEEPEVFYDKMALVGDRLYVAAHAYGLRIFDLGDPEHPVLVGVLEEGLEDAFDVEVVGSTAYVADGAGGLKVVSVADETLPVIVAGESLATARGTSEHVLAIDGDVFVAAGGAGVAHYPGGDLSRRVFHDTPRCAISLARVGQYLAVGDVGGVRLFALEADGSLREAASESGLRRMWDGRMTLRVWHGVEAWGTDRLLAANWDSVDVYSLAEPGTGSQPDATVSRQRIRFAPGGGSEPVTIENQGAAPLVITDIVALDPTFSASPRSAVLPPGGSLEVTIGYSGGSPGSSRIHVESNDPDEGSLPIQVFGETAFLDPGEPAAPFSLPAWSYDHASELFVHDTFDTAALDGRVLYFQVFGTW